MNAECESEMIYGLRIIERENGEVKVFAASSLPAHPCVHGVGDLILCLECALLASQLRRDQALLEALRVLAGRLEQ